MTVQNPLDPVVRHIRKLAGPAASAPTTDKELIERFAAQCDEAAFEEIVRRHGPMVLGTCRKLLRDGHDAEDAFQATFLILVRRATAVCWRETLGGWLHG